MRPAAFCTAPPARYSSSATRSDSPVGGGGGVPTVKTMGCVVERVPRVSVARTDQLQVPVVKPCRATLHVVPLAAAANELLRLLESVTTNVTERTPLGSV